MRSAVYMSDDNTNADGIADSSADSYSCADSCADANRSADSFTNSYTNADSFAHTSVHSDTIAVAEANRDTSADGNAGAVPDTGRLRIHSGLLEESSAGVVRGKSDDRLPDLHAIAAHRDHET